VCSCLQTELSQCGVDGERILARMAWSAHQMASYLRDAPLGYDTVLWRQAVEQNPEPTRLLPHPLRGLDELAARADEQRAAGDNQKAVLADFATRTAALDKRVASAEARIAAIRGHQKQARSLVSLSLSLSLSNGCAQLSHRLLRALCAQQCAS